MMGLSPCLQGLPYPRQKGLPATHDFPLTPCGGRSISRRRGLTEATGDPPLNACQLPVKIRESAIDLGLEGIELGIQFHVHAPAKPQDSHAKPQNSHTNSNN